MDKHGSIMRIMENKRKTVEEFVVKGERLMEDPKSPKFLETHVSKLKEAWDDAQKKAQERKKYHKVSRYFLGLHDLPSKWYEVSFVYHVVIEKFLIQTHLRT